MLPAVTTSRHGASLAGSLETFAAWCSRRRYEAAPLAGNAALTGIAWTENLSGVGLGTGLAYGAATAASGALAGLALKHKHQHLASAGAGLTAILADAGINAMAGPSTAGLIASAIATAASYAVYIPWLTRHRHERLALHVQAAKAGTLAGGMGLAAQAPGITGGSAEETAIYRALAALGATPLSIDAFQSNASGWVALVTLPPGRATSPGAVSAKREQLRTNLGLPGRLTLGQGPQGNQLIIRMQTVDPLADPIPWPGPSITSVKQAMTVGLFADGTPILLDVMADHILVAGATDKGKSGLLNVIIANLAGCPDVKILGIDMKPGALELGPWQAVMHALASGAEGAEAVADYVVREMELRGEHLATLRGPDGEPVRKWIPGNPDADPDSPEWGHGDAWVLVIDELAELVRQTPKVADRLITLNQVARAMGIRILAATQSPSERAFGGKGTDARQQYGTRIGLGVNESVTVNLILGAGALGAGWRLQDLDAPGKLMISSKRYGQPQEARAYWIGDGQIAATARLNATRKADPDGTPPDGGGTKPRLLKSVPCFPDGSEIPANRQSLWQALDRRGAEGATILELLAEVAGTGLNQRTSISDPIQSWKARGWVVDGGRRDASKVFILARHAEAA
ncbi:FtsK/SpoIIIE domain-containing protein [Streptacidiphilus carbonis]|uniref:FtsK/SpoIIIE domain-containing protein n=1 Tax=Streptacidiphilus carbonis TaxID=105422 RepID=UPI0005A98BBA|nr:FtsK/SpoIIIE domain-containing protein [Streptacidiphilus carbonis]